jgi:membrane-associated phospholipid phosphatase
MMKSGIPGIFITLILSINLLYGQEDTLSVYKHNRWLSAGIGLTGAVLHQIGLPRTTDKALLPLDRVLGLNKTDVNGFDRVALRQNPEKEDHFRKISDYVLNASALLPFTLFLDKQIRQDWLDVFLLYVMAQGLQANLYDWSPLGPTFIERIRPISYYDEVDIDSRVAPRTRNSFFSGHASTAAAGTFFTAKVYCDYHPGLGAKQIIVYGLAAIPPVLVGALRVKSLSHFPSDIIVGGIIGAGSGVLIPHLFRNKSRKWVAVPIYQEYMKGVAGMIRLGG